MRVIRNSLGIEYSISLTLGEVRRLQQGFAIEGARVLSEDFGHSDSERLQEQIDRIITLPLFAADLLYALMPASLRQQLSFSQFIGEDSTSEPWKPADLLLATMALADEVLDFFQGRIPEAAGLRRVIHIGHKDAQAMILGIEELTDDQFQLAAIAGQLKLDPAAYRPIILAMKEPATMTVEQASQAINELWKKQSERVAETGGITSTDSPESLASVTWTDSPIENSVTAPQEPLSEQPLAPLSSPLLQAS